MIEVKDLTKTYTIDGQALKAVDKVSFAVGKGEMVSIIGHSGSGKTTLLSLIGGLTKPDSGQVMIDGINLWSMNDDCLSEFRNKKINFIYQFSSLIPTLTTIENVMLPTAFGNYSEDIEGYARELIRVVGLEDKMNSYPSHLSGGQQRRVAIARAFINSPEIVLADEPTGDLDEDTEKEVIQLFHRMNEEKGITFIVVTHNKEIANQAKKQFKMTNGILSAI
ncbi:MAG: ABC transporter ATP-binding protein [Nitrospirae bacterium]|nr:ABC transporter ATP-binding protein [Nitrospirota bacterium]MCL5421959.1 ABC transporter ATP-binding protein [Nitrospirota bacterium]